jgi:hypothetical protein
MQDPMELHRLQRISSGTAWLAACGIVSMVNGYMTAVSQIESEILYDVTLSGSEA